MEFICALPKIMSDKTAHLIYEQHTHTHTHTPLLASDTSNLCQYLYSEIFCTISIQGTAFFARG